MVFGNIMCVIKLRLFVLLLFVGMFLLFFLIKGGEILFFLRFLFCILVLDILINLGFGFKINCYLRLILLLIEYLDGILM